MQPFRKWYSHALHVLFITLLICCIPLFAFLWDLSVVPAHNVHAQTLSPTSTPSAPVSVTITSPIAGTLYIAPAAIFMNVDASSTAGTITKVQVTDLLAPGPVDNLTPRTTPTSGTTTGALPSSTTPHTVAIPLTTPPPLPTCNDPLTVPCVSIAYPYTFRIINVQAGRHVFVATAFDSSGNSSSSSVYIPVTAEQPVITILTPSANATFTAPAQIVLTASIAKFPGTVTSVLYFNGTAYLGTATTAPYSLPWNIVRAGTYTLTAFASDSLGNARDSAPVTITVNPQGTAACKVQYQVVSQWPGGFSTNVTITNTGTTAINGWNLQFSFGGDQKITNLWNGHLTQSGQQVTITNVSYNSTIAPQAAISFGFNGTWNLSNASPILFTLNGQSCTQA